MSSLKKYRWYIATLIVLVCTAIPVIIAGTEDPKSRTLTIRARQYAYDPSVITVNKGDTVHITLKSLDVIHGFYLEGHNIDVHIFPMAPTMRVVDESQPDGYRPIDEIVFVAERTGKFRIRCSHTCGTLHPFMQGEFIVEPNYPFLAGIGAASGIFLAGSFIFMTYYRKPEKESAV